MTALILASASFARAALLKAAGVPFTAQPADVDETAAKRRGAAPGSVAQELADRKAKHISAKHPDAMVLGADQVLVFEGEIISKAQSSQEAAGFLKRLRGKSHKLITAAALARNGSVLWRHAEEATLSMRRFSDSFLHDYVARESDALLSCVGGYRLEGMGVQLFERIDGDYFSILGLPLLPVLAALRQSGVLEA